MTRHISLPPFITFEGGEGAGKSTQIKMLSDFLKVKSIPHIITREPGGAPGAEVIRNLLVNGDIDRWDAKTETVLFMAARLNHIEHTIKPAREAGKWVLCDRYMDSTRVYQSLAKKVDKQWTESLFANICESYEPELTLLLDIPPEKGLSRAEERASGEGRFEAMNIEFHHKVRSGFLELAQQNQERFFICDATQTPEKIHEEIASLLTSRFAV